MAVKGYKRDTAQIRTGYTPLEISCDTTGLQAVVDPRTGNGNAVGAPAVLNLVKPGSDLLVELVQSDVKVLGLAPLGGRAVKLAAGVDEPAGTLALVFAGSVLVGLHGVEEVAASVTLVTTGAEVVADAAFTLNVAIGQEGVVLGDGAEGLGGFALLDEAVLPELGKDLLGDAGVLVGGGAAELVEADAEPVVDILMEGVVLGAKSRGVYALGKGLGLGGSAILVGTADVEGGQATGAAETGEDIGRLKRVGSATRLWKKPDGMEVVIRKATGSGVARSRTGWEERRAAHVEGRMGRLQTKKREREAYQGTYQNATNDVAQMGDVVDVGQGTGDEDVLLALLGQDWSVFAGHFCGGVVAMSCCRWAGAVGTRRQR